MEKKFSNYYKLLGMGKLFLEKMSAHHDQYKIILNDPAIDVIVSEYVTKNGQREYTNALFFSKKFVFEIESCLSDSPKYWIANLLGNISYFALTPKDFNFLNGTVASRLNFECKWRQGTTFVLNITTSGDNCKHLLKIIDKHIKPNIT